jgi:hypothetical protein
MVAQHSINVCGIQDGCAAPGMGPRHSYRCPALSKRVRHSGQVCSTCLESAVLNMVTQHSVNTCGTQDKCAALSKGLRHSIWLPSTQ